MDKIYPVIFIWNVLQSTQSNCKHNRIITQHNNRYQIELFPQTNKQ